MNDKFFALVCRLRYIDRWSLMRNTRKENVAEHSYITALIAHALCSIQNELYGGKLNADRAATLAIYHESAEVLTGDLPTPVKYYGDDIRKAYKSLESTAENKLLGYLPTELESTFSPLVSQDKSSPEYAFVKYADKIAALIKCSEELACGNAEFKAAKESAEKFLRAQNVQAVDYFLNNFAEAFGKSLDETL